MSDETEVETGRLQQTTFKQLFDAGVLPSGHTFELMPDTVDIALRVSEVGDALPWSKKALQAYIVAKNIGGHELHDEGLGAEFIHGMLDIDVIFLSLAWTAQLNGMALKLSEGVPCPGCNAPFREVPFGNIVIFSRPAPVSGPDATFRLDKVDDAVLPPSLKNGTFFLTDPTWRAARQNVSEKSWSIPEVVAIHRALSCLRFSSNGNKGAPRAVSFKAEGMKLSTAVVAGFVRKLDEFVPHFHPTLDLVCKECEQVSVVPFEQGL
jgi:hypothetical protein